MCYETAEAYYNNVKDYGLDFFTALLNVTSSQDMLFHQPQQLHSMRLPLSYSVPCFFPFYHIGVDSQWVCHGFSVKIV